MDVALYQINILLLCIIISFNCLLTQSCQKVHTFQFQSYLPRSWTDQKINPEVTSGAPDQMDSKMLYFFAAPFSTLYN